MSNWKVFKSKIELFIHPNADQLQIGKVGSYQVVVQKGLYENGDEVVFVPEKSTLSGPIKSEFEKYLAGPNKDRVKSVRLRGELSCGIILPTHLISDITRFPFDEDISDELGISKYEPPIPVQLAGQVKRFDMPFIGHHDCEQVGVYVNELIQGEDVIILEKIHGSQNILAHDVENNKTIVSSKGLLKSGLVIDESDTNFYWIAARNENLVGRIRNCWTTGIIQIFSEIIPIQKGYDYGQIKPTLRIFDIRHNGISIPYNDIPDAFKDIWAPLIYNGPINLIEKEIVIYENVDAGIRKTKIEYILPSEIIEMSKGMEMVSGTQKHIREGVVIRPLIDRDAKDGTKLRLKLINPAYKESGDEFN